MRPMRGVVIAAYSSLSSYGLGQDFFGCRSAGRPIEVAEFARIQWPLNSSEFWRIQLPENYLGLTT